ncbi:uncharacterized protein LOC130055095 [Ostrea edulis]|uniref:uncharacterized protein LOC130055095 n=1 Tax=Ostrea edulis TaxID=37623 RepID=UPI0024AE9003|nr:uncharacterized protein LOC130055095 [Ostrea edulis]
MTALSTTWSMCTSAMDNVIPVTDHHNVQPPHTSQASSNRTLPAPSPEVLDVLRGLMRPDVQCYLTKLVEAFTDGQPDNTDFQVNKPRRPLCIDQHISNETEEHLYTLPQDSAPQMVNMNDSIISGKGHAANRPSEGTPQMAKLLDDSDVMVSKDGLRKAVSAAKKSSKPGFTLCYKLLAELFNLEELAASRGQGIGNTKDKEKPVLDKVRTQALKNYVVIWCRKNDHAAPSEQTLNSAITERICYARKQCVKQMTR